MTTCASFFEPFSGALINDNLRLVRPIAKGGMGSVWLARHTGLDLPVALKFMSQSIFRDEPNAVERFTREARAAAQLRHPNVVRIFDFRFPTPSDDPPYMVMELLEGEDLERCIRRCGPLHIGEVVTIVQAIASVLETAHERGIVHRDIKPENVFLEGPEHTVKVLDFGVAMLQQGREDIAAEEEGKMCGTPCFMSPEQFTDAADVDHRCDLWALAVVAYEALTGRMPFAGATVSAIFLAAARSRYTPPSQLRPELGPAVDAWFCKAFATRIEHRFASARELALSFSRAVAEPTASRPSRGPAAWNRWATVAIGLLGGVLATLVFTGHLRFAPAPVAASPAPPPPALVPPAAMPPTAPAPAASCVASSPWPSAKVATPPPARSAARAPVAAARHPVTTANTVEEEESPTAEDDDTL
ncbi:serine/threonine protein kinase [Pendulispora rubella]|uniref:Serine/threonine protein kinase n=1 Tax=Pendulispora rubella TaxID=2741070 RepID=A0ABZ2KQF0_9BACT